MGSLSFPKKIKIKKPSRASLLRRWGQLVLSRDKRICQKCKKPGNNPHHIFTRSRNSTAFLLENGITLCFACHCGNPYGSAHKDPLIFFEWLTKNWMTLEEYRNLEISSNLVLKYDAWSIKIYLDKMEKEINTVGKNDNR